MALLAVFKISNFLVLSSNSLLNLHFPGLAALCVCYALDRVLCYSIELTQANGVAVTPCICHYLFVVIRRKEDADT